jgi:hypothetical protein
MPPAPQNTGSSKLAIATVAMVGLITTIANDPSITVGMGVLALPIIMLAVTRMPLRNTMFGLLFLALALPNPAEGFPWRDWTAPFTSLGALLLTHWNTIDRSAKWMSPAVLSGMDILFAVLGLVAYQRRKRRARMDYAGAFATPAPMKTLARVALLSVGVVWLSGMAKGGDFGMSLWQVNNVVYLPIVFLLFQESIRGPQDFATLLKVLCAAAIYRSVFAIYVINSFTLPPYDEKLPYATAHADSILFALVFMALLILVVERVTKPFNWRVLLVLGVVFLGMVSNNRRLVWAHLGISALLVYLLVPDSAVKRWIRKWGARAIPFVVLYVMAGWNSQYGGTFKPVRILRSMVETTSDASGSSYWREIENWNLVNTALGNPLLGKGFGHQFEEFVYLPPVDYSLEYYCPHNSLLGIWAFCGYLGHAGLTTLWAAGVYYAMRAYRTSNDRAVRAAALASITGILIYMLHAFGDLGLGTWSGVFTMGASLAVAGKAAAAAAAGAVAAPDVGSVPRSAAQA